MKLISVASLVASLQLTAALQEGEWALAFLKGGCVADWTKLNYQEGGFKDKTLECTSIGYREGGYTNVDIRNFQAAGKKLSIFKDADVNDPKISLCGKEIELGTFDEDGCYPLPVGTDPIWYNVHDA